MFDFIIAHGILSWVPPVAREALLAVAAARLRPEGLLYIDYNARPGWNVRGMVRDYLIAQTAGTTGLRRRAEMAQQVAASLAASLEGAPPNPYTELMLNEFRLVGEGDVSYVAHEYLSPDNDAFWQSEMDEMTARHGLVHVAEADFNYEGGRVGDGLAAQVAAAKLQGRSVEDTVDLLSFRQHRTAILTHRPWIPRPASDDELAALLVASPLDPLPRPDEAGPVLFKHPGGAEVDVKDPVIATAFERLHPLWPRGLTVGQLFPNVSSGEGRSAVAPPSRDDRPASSRVVRLRPVTAGAAQTRTSLGIRHHAPPQRARARARRDNGQAKAAVLTLADLGDVQVVDFAAVDRQ